MSNINWSQLESLIRHDPGQRGVSSYLDNGAALGQGELQRAAEQFAAEARTVAIVTGFCVFDGEHWTAETDGPPGALYLARACQALGIEAVLVSDRYGVPVLKAGCRAWDLAEEMVLEAPLEEKNPVNTTANVEAWSQEFLHSGIGQRLTHLVSIERVGPSHTLESLVRQQPTQKDIEACFAEKVPAESCNRRHNMRGVVIDEHTARLDRLFEIAAQQRRITTIGMADGGNEIGMGRFAWEIVRQAIRQGPADRVICRIPTDYTILAGVSNWAAYAFALSVACLRGRFDLLAGWTADNQRTLIETLVRDSAAVDGVTKRHEATVDGLSLGEYLGPLAEMLHLVQHG
jgi:hypothetical protein